MDHAAGLPADRTRRHPARALVVGLLSLGLALLGLSLPGVASADTRPPTGVPATVAADALSAVQINGVVWSMVTWNNIVYATGSFTAARPAGAADGTSTTPRANLVAFNITTGVMTSFNHSLSAQGRVLTFSPDHSTLYVGGDFTTVDGAAHSHIAAFNVSTGALISGFKPTTNGSVWSLAATASTVYAGGNFTTAGGATHTRLAAFSASNGAIVPSFGLGADYPVRALLISPNGSRLIMAGDFDGITGSGTTTNTAYGLASTDLSGANFQTWNFGVTNSGAQAGIYSLSTDGTNVYATAWGYTAGNIEGVIALNPANLGLVWMNDCHGDGYGTYPAGDVIYESGHTHDCATSYSFPDTQPRIEKFAIAMTSVAKEILRPTTQTDRYQSWTGNPAPDELDWYPDLTPGTYTGQQQASWAVTGSGNYVVYAGEFTSVNGTPQQGIVRFGATSIAPNKSGPVLSSAAMQPNALAIQGGKITVNWPSNWDRDNQTLTYQLFRNGGSTPIYSVTANSLWWQLPTMSYVDTSPGSPGTSDRYTVEVTDPFGNSMTSAASQAVVVGAADSAYATGVLGDGPDQFWRFGETSGSTAEDYAGMHNLTEGSGVGHAATGAAPDGGAITLDGSPNGVAVTGSPISTSLSTFSVEGWVKTTSTTGGVVVGYGNDPAGADLYSDRDIYVDSGGHASFGMPWPNVVFQPDHIHYTVTWVYRSLRSANPVNDGQWHQIVATVGPGGATLYVDGTANDDNPDMNRADPYLTGYWQVGTGQLAGLPNAPSTNALTGSVDEVAIYSSTLSAAQVAGHWTAAGRGTPQPVARASFTATPSGLSTAVDASASTPGSPTGSITNYAWDWGDGSTGTTTTATTSHQYAVGGTYTITLSVTDDSGRTASSSRQVTVANPNNVAPTAAFTPTTNQRTVSVDASASTDSDGTITSYTWNWGDNSNPDTGKTATHTYAADGTYTITLTVTDNDGATNTATRTVSASLPVQPAFADDTFNRSATKGWGTADLGGPWTAIGAAKNLSVTPGQGISTLTAGGGLNQVQLGNVSVTSADVTTSLVQNVIPTGGGSIFDIQGRDTGPEEYQLRVKFLHTGQIKVAITRHDSTANTERLLGSEVALATPYTAGTPVNVRFQVYGTSPTTLKGKVWTGSEPAAWTVSTTDTDAGLQAPGSVGLSTYLSGSATAFPVTFTFSRFTARPVATATPANVPPTAAFTPTVTNRSVAVDASASSDSDGSIASYAWNWGDGTAAGSGKTASHTYSADGTYTITLTVTDNSGATTSTTHPVTVSGPANVPPTAAFTPTVTNRTVAVDASASSDSDGSIASYAWNWGDGTAAGSGSTASHTYTADGTYAITLTVTDNAGAATSTTHSVTVSGPANVPPTAAFTPTVTNRTVAVDASASSDSDGSIASYAWNWGDGSAAGSGKTASHTYTADGSYVITLTVTDNVGASTSTTQTVAVSQTGLPAPFVDDTFNRTATKGWGTADLGGAWTPIGAAGNLSVTPGQGISKLAAAGGLNQLYLGGVSVTSADVTTSLVQNVRPTGGGSYFDIQGRIANNKQYQVRVKFLATGAIKVAITRHDSTAKTETVLGTEVTLPMSYTAGTPLNVRFQVFGTAPTTLKAKVWSGTEPTAWTVSTTDTDSALQTAGSIGLSTYLSGSATAFPVVFTFSRFTARPVA